MTLGRLWNYHRDEIDSVDDNSSDCRSFECKPKIVGKAPERSPQLGNEGDTSWPKQTLMPCFNIEATIPLKYLRNFQRSLDLPLINSEVERDLLWAKNSVLIEHRNNITCVDFKITSTKLYVPVITLSVYHNIKYLEKIKQRFKRTISFNKYR